MKLFRCPVCACSDWIVAYFPRRIVKCGHCFITMNVQDLQVDVLLYVLADDGNYYRGPVSIKLWVASSPTL